MSIFVKVFCLLLVATATNAGKPLDPGALMDKVIKTAEPFEASVQQACSLATEATDSLLSHIKLKTPYNPRCVDKKGDYQKKAECGTVSAECLTFFKKLVSSERERVVECSKPFLKIANNQREAVENICSDYTDQLDDEKGEFGNNLYYKTLHPEGLNFNKELNRGIKQMKQNMQKIADQARSLLHEKVDLAHQTGSAWIKDVAHCVSKAGGPTLMAEWKTACDANEHSSHSRAGSSKSTFYDK